MTRTEVRAPAAVSRCTPRLARAESGTLRDRRPGESGISYLLIVTIIGSVLPLTLGRHPPYSRRHNRPAHRVRGREAFYGRRILRQM